MCKHQTFPPIDAGEPIIVTPTGIAYFPPACRMTLDQYLDWLASLRITLPPRPALTARPRGDFERRIRRDADADSVREAA